MDKNYEWTKDDDQGVQIAHSALFICFFSQQSKVSAAIIYTVINHANKCTHCAHNTQPSSVHALTQLLRTNRFERETKKKKQKQITALQNTTNQRQ